jgi:methyl-accepting chemotaxis protein
MKEDRKTYWLSIFQTRLLIRLAAYWSIYMVTLTNLLFIWRLLAEGHGDLLEQYGRFLAEFYPALIVFALLLPAVAWDSLRFSHRLVGPLVRFRRALQDLAAGRTVQPIKLREGDFLGEMRDEFNAMLDALQRLGVPVLRPADPAKDSERRHTA